jgi:hypothetical protein
MPNNHEHASSALMYPESMQSPGLFINTIPISSHLVSCQPKHPSMLFFIFQLICSTPPSNVLERPDPKLNHLFVMASIACECSKTPSKDKPNQNAVVHSIMNPTSSKSAVIVVYQKSSLCHAIARNKNAIFEGRLFTSRSKKGKEGIEHLLFGRRTQPRRQPGNDRKAQRHRQ